MPPERKLTDARIAIENFQQIEGGSFSAEQICSLLELGEDFGAAYLKHVRDYENKERIREVLLNIKETDPSLTRTSLAEFAVLRTFALGLEDQAQSYMRDGSLQLFVLFYDQATGVERAMETLSQAEDVVSGNIDERLKRDLEFSVVDAAEKLSNFGLPAFEFSKYRLFEALKKDAVLNGELIRADSSGFKLLDSLLRRVQKPFYEQEEHFPLTAFNPPDFAIQGARFGVEVYKEIYPLTA